MLSPTRSDSKQHLDAGVVSDDTGFAETNLPRFQLALRQILATFMVDHRRFIASFPAAFQENVSNQDDCLRVFQSKSQRRM